MTIFQQAPSQSADDLRTARTLIDRSMQWDTTPEGIDFWQEVADALENAAQLAEGIANGTIPPQNVPGMPSHSPAHAQPTPAVPPPLHTLTPGKAISGSNASGSRSATLPTLDQLVAKKKSPTPVTAGSPILAKEEITHVFHNGGALCGTVQGMPQNWPQGHYRVGLHDMQKATCGACVQHARQIKQ